MLTQPEFAQRQHAGDDVFFCRNKFNFDWRRFTRWGCLPILRSLLSAPRLLPSRAAACVAAFESACACARALLRVLLAGTRRG